jgi:hypothetical protein
MPTLPLLWSSLPLLLLLLPPCTASIYFEDLDDRPIWTARQKFFSELGYTHLYCQTGNHFQRVVWNNDTSLYEQQPVECCACRAIVDHFEFLMNLQTERLPDVITQDLPTTWRMGSTPRQRKETSTSTSNTVPFARHMDLILHLMPKACHNVSLAIASNETRLDKVKFVFETVCDDLFDQFEDQIGLAFYNNFSSQTDTICGDEIVSACSDYVLEYEYVEVGEDGDEQDNDKGE